MDTFLYLTGWLPTAVFFIGLPLCLFGMHIALKRHRVRLAIAILFSLVMLTIGTIEGGKSLARYHVKSRLAKLSHQKVTVTVNGAPVANANEHVRAFCTLHYHAAHHSYPLRAPIAVVLVGNRDRLHLTVRRDSTFPNEYWVYYAPYSTRREVGAVRTELFCGVNK